MGSAKLKNSARRITTIALMGATLTASKFALAFVPNIEVVTTLIIVFCYVFGFDGVLSALIFCTADIFIYPPSLDVIISYYVYWGALSITVATTSMLGVKKFWVYLVEGIIATLLFGVITSFFSSLLLLSAPFLTIYLAGLYFYALHLLSTVVFMSIGFTPLTKLLTKLKQKY